VTSPPIASGGTAGPTTGPYQVPAPWRRPDPLGQRIVLTVCTCALVIVLPFGPYRVLLALLIAVVQLIATVVVRRLEVTATAELGSYLLVEHLLMLVVVLAAPTGYLGIAIVAIGSLGSNSPYLPQIWLRGLAAITAFTLVAPALIFGLGAGPMVIGAGLFILGHFVLNRSGTLLHAEEVATAARHQADHDALTGLPNRRVLRAVLDGLDETSGPVALLLLDIDHFKEINDRLGHDVGDHVLRAVATRLAAIDNEVLIVRLGGDEFAAVVPGPTARANEFAAAVDRCLQPAMVVDAVPLSLGASIGLAHTSAAPPRLLLRYADIAMYRAKRVGAGPTWYRPEDDPHTERRIVLMQGLTDAIEFGHIQPWFQPQIDILTGEVVGGEALARWDHPRLGVVGAAELLEHVNLAGKQHEFSVAMLRHSVDAAMSWPSQIRLSVNVTLRDIQSKDFGAEVETLLAKTGFAPQRLTLEVVEFAADASTDGIVPAAQRIRSTGVSLSLDDFGQAASSLARLDLFDVDELKIERRFVARMIKHRRDDPIVDSVVALANRLGLRLVAEGVENDEMARAVAAAGIRVVQGYHYARPARTLRVERFAPLAPPRAALTDIF
jgi:diguanylate cyclase (GGDEF)-like protein